MVYVVDDEVIAERSGHHPDTTNNRMELTALLEALDLIPANTPMTVYTDSHLAVRTITEWAAGWEKRGWKRKSGPVENLDLVKRAFRGYRNRPEIKLEWIKAHVGYRWNEYADELASKWRAEGSRLVWIECWLKELRRENWGSGSAVRARSCIWSAGACGTHFWTRKPRTWTSQQMPALPRSSIC